jgi:hypothetical protein
LSCRHADLRFTKNEATGRPLRLAKLNGVKSFGTEEYYSERQIVVLVLERPRKIFEIIAAFAGGGGFTSRRGSGSSCAISITA